MLTACGCDIATADAEQLADDLDRGGAIEAAAAIRWANRLGLIAESFDEDIREAVLEVLNNAAADHLGALENLRAALEKAGRDGEGP